MYTEDFGELKTPACTLAIGSTRTLQLFGAGVARPADNHTAIIEFRVGNVDGEYRKLADVIAGFLVQEPIGATARSCSVIRTGTWSISSRRSARRRSRSSTNRLTADLRFSCSFRGSREPGARMNIGDELLLCPSSHRFACLTCTRPAMRLQTTVDQTLIRGSIAASSVIRLGLPDI
jgi:hypothetical protein